MESQASSLMKDVAALIDDVHDSVRVRPVKDGEGSLLDFLMGRIDECPVSFVLEIREDDSTS
jgi:hypothetical protein